METSFSPYLLGIHAVFAVDYVAMESVLYIFGVAGVAWTENAFGVCFVVGEKHGLMPPNPVNSEDQNSEVHRLIREFG